MSDYEHIVISAIRYALERTTYIVELTNKYVIADIKQGKLQRKCLFVIYQDIKEELGRRGIESTAWKKTMWNDLYELIEKELLAKEN